MMSTAFQSSGVALGQGHHSQQARRTSMLLGGSRKQESSSAPTFPPSSSLPCSTSTSTLTSPACPHTHRQNHNSSKLPTFRSADLNSSGGPASPRSSALPSQHRAPDNPPSAAAVGPAPGPPRRGPGSALGPECGNPQGVAPEQGQGLSAAAAAAAADGSIPGPPPDPQQDPPINHSAAAAATTPARPGPPATRQARQSLLHSRLPERETVAAPGSATLPRTRASTFIPSSISAPSATRTNNTAPPQPIQPALKSAPPTKRSASLPTPASGAEHVSRPPDSNRPNYSPTTSPTSASSSAPAPATAATPTNVPQTTERDPSVSPTTTNHPPATALSSTATSTDPPAKPTSFSRSQQARRPPLSFSGHPSPATPATSLGTQRRHTYESAQSHRASTNWTPGRRELLLPKSLSLSSSSDDKRSTASFAYRPPPISYKAPPSLSASQSSATSASTSASASPTAAAPVRVPPIRGFRSSGSRLSLVIDPASRPCQRASDGSGDENADMGSREDTLRALEGRAASSGSGRANGADGDDTTDMFLKIAQQESVRPSIEVPSPKQDHGPISRVFRSSHKRPLSAAMPSYQPMSPPQVGRRHSDQRETLRSRGADDDDDDDDPDRTIRGLPYNSFVREKAATVHPAEGLSRRATTTSFRSGSTTPRSVVSQEPGDASAYTRRRTSISDAVGHRTTSYKQSNLGYGQYRSPVYHSSPLAPRAEPQQAADYGHGPEGTESTASTTGPSTVWDELDDLKSRINRLELTGKLPSTSGAAMSRVSDDRPYTANTTATNVSSSPKRNGNGGPAANGQQADAASNVSAGQRESHPLLHQALAKSKSLLGSDAYTALEAVAMDSLALLSLMGSAGQPGPMSSGASAIGTSGVTDRQLRRKADGMCRSITELCLALNEEYSRAPMFNFSAQAEGPTTPTLVNGFGGAAAQRRPSAVAEQTGLRVATSPRTISKLEERRNNLLNSSSIPSPRAVTTPSLPTASPSLASLAPPADGVGRRSSLLISRRRAGTEEPDDGRRSTLLLRTRRAGTEEPDESGSGVRKTSLLLRPRRGTVGEGDERAPSRAGTEAPSARAVSRDYSTPQASRDYSTPGASREYSTPGASRDYSTPQAPRDYSTSGASKNHSTPSAPREYSTPGKDPSSLTSSALPRRRVGTSTAHSSRFGMPSTPIPASARRYAAETNGSGSADRSAEERTPAARPYTIGQTALLNRTASVNRRANTSGTPGQGTSQMSYR